LDIADRFKVSREVVLRRLMDRGWVTRAQYAQFVRAWEQEFSRERGQGGGGNYYATRASYLGNNYIDLAFARFRTGRISLPELADYLGMKARNVAKFEEFVMRRAS
jgi:Zn-dependent peptidase ImmA (M78 family)